MHLPFISQMKEIKTTTQKVKRAEEFKKIGVTK